MTRKGPAVVLLGRMSRYPVAGMVWLTVQYLIGLRRLGVDVHYVEVDDGDPVYVDAVMRRFDLGDRWAVDLRACGDRTYGLSEERLLALYRDADLIINLHGGTKPHDEHCEGGRLMYLETDPGELAIDVHAGEQGSIDFLRRHTLFFTWGENYGNPDCRLPALDGFDVRTTRQPVCLDLWSSDAGPREVFTTIGNWRQTYREVELDGEVYRWSKHYQFMRILDLPERVGPWFELALASCDDEERGMLRGRGWKIVDPRPISADADAYRRYVRASRGEFTIAKEQYTGLRTGWVGDRTPTYLASRRPVILQDTGFGCALPVGEGLLRFTSLAEAQAAVEEVNGDYARHARAAGEIARECFSADVVLTRLLEEAGVGL